MNQKVLTEKELEEIFSGKKKKRKYFGTVGKALAFVALCLIFYIAINAKTLFLKTKYWYDVTYKNAQNQNLGLARVIDSKTTDMNAIASNVPAIPDNTISISAINVSAPVVWNVPNNPTDVSANLSKGVIHLSGTALPGQIGNVFLTGHSSNYPWAKGKYNNIFALLNKLVVGDLVQIRYEDKDYVYKVTGSAIVKPDDVSVLEQGNQSVLSLMTCTPVGTSLNRLVVTAKQVFPDPKMNSLRAQNNNQPEDLPKAK